MQDIYAMLLMLIIGTMILMFGILLSREPEQSLQSALKFSLTCGVCFFLALGAQVLVIAWM